MLFLRPTHAQKVRPGGGENARGELPEIRVASKGKEDQGGASVSLGGDHFTSVLETSAFCGGMEGLCVGEREKGKGMGRGKLE